MLKLRVTWTALAWCSRELDQKNAQAASREAQVSIVAEY